MAELSNVLENQVKQLVDTPKDWKVVLVNDDQTPMDFVVDVLVEIFNHTYETAGLIMMQIHEEGSGIAGVYSFEIAEVKSIETTTAARTNGYPLQVKLEEDS